MIFNTLRRSNRRTPRLRARRGIALFVAMFMVVAIGALALSAIYLTSNATLISKSYEREDDLKYESEAALAIGKSELNFNPAALPGSSFVALMKNKTLQAADGQPINGMTVNVYVGQTGNSTGQFSRFASVVSEARDNNGTGFVRRLELTQESFAKFAYWSNSETSGGGAIYFGLGDAIWGPVFSNDTLNIASTGATFHDDVATAAIINGVSYGTFAKGYEIHQKPITLPSLTKLTSLSDLATVSGFNFTAPTADSTVRMRIEFLAADMDANGDSIEANEGFFRVYTANLGQEDYLRGNWLGSSGTLPAFTSSTMRNCGDWHLAVGSGAKKLFFPFASHAHTVIVGGVRQNTWFDTVTAPDRAGVSLASRILAAHKEGDSATVSTTNFGAILYGSNAHPKITCFLGGDPHLVSVARTLAAGAGHYDTASVHKGGDDTTFTAIDQYGSWSKYTDVPGAVITTARAHAGDAKYLYPLYRGFNPNTKGVIYVGGTVGVSGVVNGDVTLYTPDWIVVLDDLRYANDPATGVCKDILGMISGLNMQVADNGLNTPSYVATGQTRSMDNDTPDLYVQAVIMALGTSFYVQNYGTGPSTGMTCGTTTNGRGCFYLTGGLIQNNRGPVGTSAGTGYAKRYSYDHCAVVNPPPYFPTTGRFQDNRYLELDPVNFNVTNLFKSLSPTP